MTQRRPMLRQLALSLVLSDRVGISHMTAVLAAIGMAIPVFVFGALMPARTVKGARVREHVLGFEEFLDRVESDRFKRMITSPEMFERFLPYAMAFGVERKWAKAFEDIYTEPPTWYVGAWHGGFHTTSLANRLASIGAKAMRPLLRSRPKES